MKRSIIALVYVLIIVLMILLYMLVKRAEHQKQLQKNGKNVALYMKHNNSLRVEPLNSAILKEKGREVN